MNFSISIPGEGLRRPKPFSREKSRQFCNAAAHCIGHFSPPGPGGHIPDQPNVSFQQQRPTSFSIVAFALTPGGVPAKLVLHLRIF